uniref:Serpentine Receptor, class H n=1 Tax=Panagrolaimus davidi TaxID=227884 RepID=A0A914Q7E0_9BILA
MSDPKVIEPLGAFVTFYYYYSYLTLFGTWLISPLLFYVILTKSGKLGNFKWFILNHSFWCLVLETIFGIVKPIILTPSAAGFQLGPFRHLFDFKSSVVFTFVCLGICGNCVISLSATLASRYLLVFPTTIFRWFSLKVALIFAVIINAICYALIGYVLYPIIQLKQETIYEWADSEDSGLKIFYEKEPTFFMVPYYYHEYADILILLFFLVVHIAGAFILIFFFYHLFQRKTKALTNKIQRSLLASSLAQTILTSVFLFIPFIVLFGALRFQVANTTSIGIIFLCLFNSHAFVEFIVTLYFVSPYRSFCIQLIRPAQRYRNSVTTLASISTY